MDAAKQSRAALRKNSIIATLQLVFGWILVITMAFSLWGSSLEPVVLLSPFDIALISIIMAVGVMLLIFGTRRKQLEKTFRTYVGLISSQQVTSIIRLAQNTGVSVDIVIKNLNKMIGKNFLANAHIDLNKNEIVISGAAWQPQQGAQVIYPQNVRVVSVKCSGCGAVNTKYEGTPSACEYCGTTI